MKFSIIIFISFILTSCNTDTKFDKNQWLQQDDLGQFTYRKNMIKDLTTNHKLVGLSYKQLIDFIGQPAKNFENKKDEISYPINVGYGRDIDPVFTKTLILKISNDSTYPSTIVRPDFF